MRNALHNGTIVIRRYNTLARVHPSHKRPTHPKKNMPLDPVTIPTLVMFLFWTVPSTFVVATLAGPSSAAGPSSMDAWACVGAMLASALAAADACRKDKSFSNMISVVLSSAFVGSVGPGAFSYYVMPDKAAIFTWHMWAAAGLVFGLGGFGLVKSITVMWDKYRAKLETSKFPPDVFRDKNP